LKLEDNQSGKQKRAVFIDKTAFIAFMNIENPRHTKARSLFLELDDLERPLVTTKYVIYETHEWLRNNIGYEHAQFFLNTIDKSLHKGMLSILTVNEEWEQEAKDLLIENPGYEFSMPEALVAITVSKHHVDRIFSFNTKFRQLPQLQPNIKVMPSSI
jgi:predicted nucleic acid-binding protein